MNIAPPSPVRPGAWPVSHALAHRCMAGLPGAAAGGQRFLVALALLSCLGVPVAVAQTAPAADLPASAGAAAADAADAPDEVDSDAAALARVLAAINRFRAEQGLSPWRSDVRLQALALQASQSMQAQGQASHDGFQRRFELSRASHCVEVIARGAPSEQVAVQMWQQSPQHRRSLLSPRARLAGVGQAGVFTTVLACDTVRP